MTTRSPPTSFRVQKYLAGLRYPAAKPQILARARERGADEGVLRALGSLRDGEYASPIALSCEVGRIAQLA